MLPQVSQPQTSRLVIERLINSRSFEQISPTQYTLSATMVFSWLWLVALAGVVGGGRIPRQYNYNADHSQGGGLGRVSLARETSNFESVAVCRLVSSAGHQVSGDVVFRQTNFEDPVEITGSILGLAPGYHGFHVHQNANLTENCKAAGPHFNPDNKSHGAPHDNVRHAGDLGNIPVDRNGISVFQILDDHISLFDNHPRQILNRAIVVHEKEDDLGRGGDAESKKTGNAGARVACCIIEPAPRYL